MSILAATMLDSHVPELPWINADFPMDPSCQERTYEEIRMLPLEIIAQSAGNSEPLKNPQKIR